MSKKLDLEALEATAEAAGTRRWGYEVSGHCGSPVYKVTPQCTFGGSMELTDAAHIAAFDPPTALAMIAEIRRLESEIKQARKCLASSDDWKTEQAQNQCMRHLDQAMWKSEDER